MHIPHPQLKGEVVYVSSCFNPWCAGFNAEIGWQWGVAEVISWQPGEEAKRGASDKNTYTLLSCVFGDPLLDPIFHQHS